jgi:hypothetical protein
MVNTTSTYVGSLYLVGLRKTQGETAARKLCLVLKGIRGEMREEQEVPLVSKYSFEPLRSS